MYCNVGKHVCWWSGTWSCWRQDDQQNTKAIYMSQWLLPSPLSKAKRKLPFYYYFTLIKRFSSSHACGGWWPIWQHVRMIRPSNSWAFIIYHCSQQPNSGTTQMDGPESRSIGTDKCSLFLVSSAALDPFFISQTRTIKMERFFKNQDWLGLMPRGADLEALVLFPYNVSIRSWCLGPAIKPWFMDW